MMKGKIAGLPTYVWLGVLAGGLLLGIYLRHRGGGGSNQAGLTDGLSGQSVGGGGSADVSSLDPSLVADLMNQLSVESQDVQSLVAQEAGLTDALGGLTLQIASSGGAGAGNHNHHPKKHKAKKPHHHPKPPGPLHPKKGY